MSIPFVKLARSIESHDLWLAEPFTRGQAWVDLILKANHRDGAIFVRGVMLPVLRGQVGLSEIKLAERWQWSRGKVKRFLNQLKSMGQIEQQTNNRTSIITILNYDKFQSKQTTDDTANNTTDGQQTVQQTDSRRDTNKNIKNIRTREEEPPYIPPRGGEVGGLSLSAHSPKKLDSPSKVRPSWTGFCSCWDIYPVKQGKESAWKEWCRLEDNQTLEESWVIREKIIIMNQKDDRWQRGFAPKLKNWLHDKGWEDEPFKGPEITSSGVVRQDVEAAWESALSALRASGPERAKAPDLVAHQIIVGPLGGYEKLGSSEWDLKRIKAEFVRLYSEKVAA